MPLHNSLVRARIDGNIKIEAEEAAKDVIDRAERAELSERDSLRVLDVLENPPAPNSKLLAAAHRLVL